MFDLWASAWAYVGRKPCVDGPVLGPAPLCDQPKLLARTGTELKIRLAEHLVAKPFEGWPSHRGREGFYR